MTRAHVLITGAGGFVGSALATGFAALGYQVTAQDIVFDPQTRARLDGVTLLQSDLAAVDGTALPDLPQADIVIHAAAITTGPQTLGWTTAAHVTANTLPLLAMLRHAAQTRPKAFVFISSSGVFAPGDGSPDLTDTDMPTAQGPYSAAKRAGECLVPSALPDDTKPFCLRLGYLYGPHEAARPTRMRVSLMQDWIDTARTGGTIDLPHPAPRRDWTFVPDLAPAIARLVDGPGDAMPRHLCAPDAVSDSDAVGWLRDRFPGVSVRTVPATGIKAPMRASHFAALDGFRWTDLAAGLAQITAAAA